MFSDGFQYGVAYSLNFIHLVEHYALYSGNGSIILLKIHQFYNNINFPSTTIYRIMRFKAARLI
jgi:hypothetical protein